VCNLVTHPKVLRISMKAFLLFFLLFLIACKDKEPSKDTRPISQAQKGIQNIVDSFKIDYSNATSEAIKDSTINKYNRKIFNFLSTNNIDSIQVHVDTVISKDLSITTKFHSNQDIAFQYTMNFQQEMNKQWDSIYKFMKNQTVGSNTIVNFAYMGSHQLFAPSDAGQPTLKVFAFPVPKLHRKE
jgi:hypothetical protein